LRERYGIKDSRFPKLSGWLGYAIFFGIIGIGWLLWSANHYSKPEIRSTLISFNAIDAKGIDIRYSVSFRDSKVAHSCQLLARDYGANIVGEITQNFPAGKTDLTQITRIPTRALAVNADITACRRL
jgi:hypothetical protein